ncbi:MAG: phosphotransferase family protein [Mycobacteriales bacterium]
MSETYRPPAGRTLEWAGATLGGARIVRSRRLTGGLSAHIDRLTVESRGERYDVVLRRWPPGEWGPGLVKRESAALTALAAARPPLSVPRLLAADATGEHTGASSLLMTAVAGRTELQAVDLDGYVAQLAVTLARVHDVPANLEPTDPYGFDEHANRSWIGDPVLAGTAIEAAAAADGTPAFVHGDYQPLNVLWSGPRLSGLVDWAFAGRGVRELDVGHCRLALATLTSVGAAEDLLHRYKRETALRLDPRADLRALLTYGPGWRSFVTRVVAGRAPVDLPGMTDRVTELLRRAVGRLG